MSEPEDVAGRTAAEHEDVRGAPTARHEDVRGAPTARPEDRAVARPARLEDVAALAGVSASTVSRTLSGSTHVAGPTRERVLRAAEQLDFAVSRSASSLASGLTRRIALLVGGHLEAWFTGQVLEGLYPAVHDAGFDLTVYRVCDTAERREFFTHLPARRNADAMVVTSFHLEPGEHARLDSLGVPIVYLNATRPGAATVAIDDVAAERTAVRHLLSLGHRRFAWVAGRQADPRFVWSADARREGFHAELDEAGIEAGDRSEILVGLGQGAGAEAVAHLLAGHRRPTALCVISDDLALAVVQALRRFGIGVPQEISVVGFDDIDLAGLLDLTTVRQPVRDMGARAGRMAVDLAAGAGEPAHVAVPTTLVLRSTTGPVPS